MKNIERNTADPPRNHHIETTNKEIDKCTHGAKEQAKSGGKDTKRNGRIPAFEFHDQKNKKGPNVEVHKDPYIKAPNHCF